MAMVTFRFDGSALRQRRRSAGLTVSQLAAAIGRSEASVQHYQSGHTLPPTAAVLALSAALGVEPGALFSPGPEWEEAMI
jgi:transcriptional regulator with XRE-family HTH domain